MYFRTPLSSLSVFASKLALDHVRDCVRGQNGSLSLLSCLKSRFESGVVLRSARLIDLLLLLVDLLDQRDNSVLEHMHFLPTFATFRTLSLNHLNWLRATFSSV